MLLSLDGWTLVSRNKTTYESLETSSQLSHSWHGDMTDIVDQQ
jgi:hypothetical protein